ncbi:MAG: DEAD/DEAH box helicase family protein [Burkholderiaceae bacterium]
MLTPRNYQQAAHDAALAHCRRTDEPGIVEVGTAGGKSVVVALLAHHVQKTGKRVLCLAPNADLVEQNAEKYRATGEKCAIFCASLGKKNTGHPVVFASPLSVLKNLDRFTDDYALVISDESQGVAEDEESAYQQIFSHLRAKNPKLRIVGLTATPSRLKTKLVSDKTTFKHFVYRYPHHKLSADGWTVPFVFGKNHEDYDLGNVKQKSTGQFDQAQVDAATLGHERLTRAIIADVVATMDAQDRKCAMVFASSIKHAEEIMSYLPDGARAALVTGKTPKKLRAKILALARGGHYRFLVTVSALAVGTDVPIVDTIAILRATESAGLYVQQLGRGCRLHDPQWRSEFGQMNWQSEHYRGKRNCLVLDYAHNLDRFAMSDDLTITGLVDLKEKDEPFYFQVACPDCGTENRHTAQRCVGIVGDARCDYRFVWKDCHKCQTRNSPTARYCRQCDAELIDPNEKLALQAAIVGGKPFYAVVEAMDVQPHAKGNEAMLRVNYRVSADGKTAFHVSEYLKPDNPNPFHRRRFQRFVQQVGATEGSAADVLHARDKLTPPPRLILKKKPGSKYYEVVDYKST